MILDTRPSQFSREYIENSLVGPGDEASFSLASPNPTLRTFMYRVKSLLSCYDSSFTNVISDIILFSVATILLVVPKLEYRHHTFVWRVVMHVQ